MSESKLLAEWFWTDRWMGSSAFLLPQEPRGVYREMLTQAWRRGAALPNDHDAIMRATGTTSEEWARCWPRIARYWRVEGETLVNDTQLLVYAEALAGQTRASERGKKGAQARAQALAQVGTQAPAQAEPGMVLKGEPPSPSPSPSPSPVSVSGRTDDGERPPVHATAEEARRKAIDRIGPPGCRHVAVAGKLAPGKTVVCPDCGEEFRGPATDGGPRGNPFVAGRRAEYELEALKLCQAITALTGEDGAEIFTRAAHYEGALRQKCNPANMTEDRLLLTVQDLRAILKAEQDKRAKGAA